MDRIVDSSIRWHILRRNGQWIACVVLVFWGLTLLAYILGLCGLVFVRRGRELTTQGFVVTSLVLTVLACLHIGRWYLRASVLARRGIQVKGTVRNVGGVKDFRP